MASEMIETETETTGIPSVDSNDPNERKLARRMRIKRRLENAERLQAIADGTYKEPEPEKPLIDETIETCEDTLRQLYLEGKELVSNIMIASDSKEVARREKEAEEKNLRLDKLKEEATSALEKLNEISKKWEIILNTSGPLELFNHMKEQKAKCLELIEQKNGLIKGFQLELKLADEKFMKDRKLMYQELSLLTKRIDEQVLLMKKAYRIELNNLEESIDVTRKQIIDKHMNIWQSLYNQREKDETVNMERKFEMVENFHEELHKLHVDHEENYRENRIQLETDIQILEQELEQIKALCLLNSEKLDYNYQVLKKREEENVYIKNHQKRRLNKLQDMVNTLKKKIDEKRQSTDEEFKKLTKEVERYYTSVLDTERKAEHFSKVNDEKFQSIWNMKDEEAKDLVGKIFAADMVIYEQILGQTWAPPAATFVNKMDLPSYKMAESFVNDSLKSNESSEKPHFSKNLLEKETSPEILEGHRRLLRHILELVADQSGFLMEEKLDMLLEPYTEDEKTFVKLDNVFVAIGIRTEEDIQTMKKIFFPYTICLLCEKKDASLISLELRGDPFDLISKTKTGSKQHSILQIRELEEKVSKLRIQAKLEQEENQNDLKENQEDSARHLPKGFRDSGDNYRESRDHGRESHSKRESRENRPDDSTSTKNEVQTSARESHEVDTRASVQATKGQCNITHPLIIEKYQVLKALRDFVTVFHSDRCRMMSGITSKLDKKRFTISRLLTTDDVNTFWEHYKELLPTKIENIWNAVHKALSRYLAVLQERHELNLKAQAVRKQNVELKRLLTFYTKGESRKECLFPVIPTVPNDAINSEELQNITNKLLF